MKSAIFAIQVLGSWMFLGGCSNPKPSNAKMAETSIDVSDAQGFAAGRELELSGTSSTSSSGTLVTFNLLFSGVKGFDINRCQGTLTIAGKTVPLQPMSDNSKAYADFSAAEIQTAAIEGSKYHSTLKLSCN